MSQLVYEERLGTERMLPLIFHMALPAIAAQIVNLLYNLVDRIYIGHIPGIGTDALAGIGVTSSIIILISAFSAIVGSGGAPLAAIALGQNDRARASLILGNGFTLLLLFSLVTSSIVYLFMRPILLMIVLRSRLSVDLSVGNPVRPNRRRPQLIHQHPGPTNHRDALGHNWRRPEYPARSAVHFRLRDGRERRGMGNHHITSLQRGMGTRLSLF